MKQVWHDLLFAHWPVLVEQLRPLIPPSLQIDTYAGQAWIGVVPFRMSGIRPRWMPALPWISAFPELNVRTYVIANNKPGVWFFSLEAANPVAVTIARRWYHLPYFRAQMSCRREGNGIAYESYRIHRGAPPAAFVGQYHPVGPVFQAERGSLVHWLIERYCLYALDPQQRLYRGEIDHPPWSLQLAEAAIATETLTTPLGVKLPIIPPLLHFSCCQKVVVWSLTAVAK
jgi:uncharacterized protein YqjF (DUF2071 family)